MSNALSTTGILVQRRAGVSTIVSSSVANPTILTFTTPHGFSTGDEITVASHTGSTPAVDGALIATRVSALTVSVPVNVSVGGTGGTATADADFVTIGEITKVTPPGYSRNKIETSTHNDGTESYILGILRQKDCAFTINYVANDATHVALLNDILSSVRNDWKILFPSAVQFVGPARIQQFQVADAPVDGAQQADITLAWAGPVVQS